MSNEIKNLEKQIFDLSQKLSQFRKNSTPAPVSNYEFKTLGGTTTLKDLFAGKQQLMVVHNMGQGCRYCTLWADGINGFLPHLESIMSVCLLSKDEPEQQRRFANSRGWRFQMASHGGGKYITEQTVAPEEKNAPGVVLYELKGDQILRKNSSLFGPHDEFCSIWNLIGLAGYDEENWTPQYQYWKRPEKMDDGGQNLT